MTKDVNLAPIRFTPSRKLWYLQLLFGFLLISASIFAVISVALQNLWWLIIELGFIALTCAWLINSYKATMQAPCELRVYAANIYLTSISREAGADKSAARDLHPEILVGLIGEVLVWSWIIILPLKEINHTKSNKIKKIIILRDSCSSDDWRKLRVYLLNQI